MVKLTYLNSGPSAKPSHWLALVALQEQLPQKSIELFGRVEGLGILAQILQQVERRYLCHLSSATWQPLSPKLPKPSTVNISFPNPPSCTFGICGSGKYLLCSSSASLSGSPTCYGSLGFEFAVCKVLFIRHSLPMD